MIIDFPNKPLSDKSRFCYYQSNHSKVEAIPLSALPKDTTSELEVVADISAGS